ncbi:MAG TPA: TIM-barrel domain-containing protein [Sphingomicrobium sp.]|nr:TIM-barrel domain-containing protein [Sphingomicrobium sp.]
MNLRFSLLACVCGIMASPSAAAPMALVGRNGSYFAIEPLAPNVVHVTLALEPDLMGKVPNYGVIAKSDASNWSHSSGSWGDRFTSGAMTVTVDPQPSPGAPSQMARYFLSSLPPVSLSISRADCKPLKMTGWEMAPHVVNGERTFEVGASFSVTPQEHFYGLGQNQEGHLDLRGRTIDCRHNYDAPAGEQVCVPVLVSSNNYMIIWDNPSATIVSPGLNNSTHFQSNVGERVSFYIVTGRNADDLYRGYRLLTGTTPLPPKAAFGLIQSKARYESQKELLSVAEGYRRRGYPLDVMVLDWFYWTRMGQLDIDRTYFPDPAGMNRQLHDWGMHSIISIWPRFERESRYFDLLASRGWLLKDKEGNPVDGLPVRSDRAGALIDSTNPEAREWFWAHIRDNILKEGFDWTWLDETEPDLVPDGFFYSIGSGDRFHNLFPLVHTMGVAAGSARDRPNFRNLILARAAYLGAQASGAIFWTSDVQSTWEALKRQVPANLNMAASGIAYTSSDTGGWQFPNGPEAQRPLLLDPAGATAMPPSYRDYPELFVRWFELNSFTPTLRIHGQRPGTAIWEYGKAAEPILADYLRLRYSLIPYLYSLGHQTYETGAPFMRALFMDFPGDPNVTGLTDEYMLGPAFLVAPVLDQGITTRSVYLPAGTDWYDWWTNKQFHGGQWIQAAAPIERLPLFVRAGSIVPLGAQVPNTMQRQMLSEIRVFPGANGSFTLYDDDGITNAYKSGAGTSARLQWDDHAKRLIASSKLPTGQNPAILLKVTQAGP